MTFEKQVESLTGLTISSSDTNPTQDELTQFLKDGIVDVINRMTEISPSETLKFTNSTSDSNNNGIEITGKSVSIVREHNSATILRPCTLISAQDRYEATDKDSIKYRSEYNPGYYILDGKLFSIPASTTSNNALIVTQVFYPESSYSQSSISNFPNEFEPLVVNYAAIKSLEAKMAEYTIEEEDSELAQSIGLNLGVLSKQYDAAFMLKAPKQQSQPQGGE
jgi:hypothetical protein